MADNTPLAGGIESIAALGAGETFSGVVHQAKKISAIVESDESGTAWLEESVDGVTDWRRVKASTTSPVKGGGYRCEVAHQPDWAYVRFGYTNGPTPQTRFTLRILVD
jgi:hypothetical protein